MMLPSTLTPATLEPNQVSQCSQVSTALKKIECVDVKSTVNRDGSRIYVVEIYEYAPKNRIPTNRSKQDPGFVRTPVACVERRYLEFADLRGRVYNHVFDAHDLTPCDFCQSVIDEVVWGDKPGSLLKLFSSEAKVAQTLAKFVNAFLDLVKCNGEMRLCMGQDQVPQVLYDFLFNQESP